MWYVIIAIMFWISGFLFACAAQAKIESDAVRTKIIKLNKKYYKLTKLEEQGGEEK